VNDGRLEGHSLDLKVSGWEGRDKYKAKRGEGISRVKTEEKRFCGNPERHRLLERKRIPRQESGKLRGVWEGVVTRSRVMGAGKADGHGDWLEREKRVMKRGGGWGVRGKCDKAWKKVMAGEGG